MYLENKTRHVVKALRCFMLKILSVIILFTSFFFLVAVVVANVFYRHNLQ